MRQSPLALCPEPVFRTALEDVCPLLNGSCARAGGADAIVANFLNKSSTARCLVEPEPPAWPLSQRVGAGLLINLGDGSTGTRFIDCALAALFPGLRRLHGGRHAVRRCNATTAGGYGAGSGINCTAYWDSAGYVSDHPVPEQVAALLATHPGSLTAGALLSLRDPWAWSRARFKEIDEYERKHPAGARARGDPHARDLTPPALCEGGVPVTSLGDATDVDGTSLALDVLTYDTWALCVTKRAGHDVLAFSLFDTPEAELEARLWAFLRLRSPVLSTRLGPLAHFSERLAACRSSTSRRGPSQSVKDVRAGGASRAAAALAGARADWEAALAQQKVVAARSGTTRLIRTDVPPGRSTRRLPGVAGGGAGRLSRKPSFPMSGWGCPWICRKRSSTTSRRFSMIDGSCMADGRARSCAPSSIKCMSKHVRVDCSVKSTR